LKKTGHPDKMIVFKVLTVIMILGYEFFVFLWPELGGSSFLREHFWTHPCVNPQTLPV